MQKDTKTPTALIRIMNTKPIEIKMVLWNLMKNDALKKVVAGTFLGVMAIVITDVTTQDIAEDVIHTSDLVIDQDESNASVDSDIVDHVNTYPLRLICNPLNQKSNAGVLKLPAFDLS